MFLSTNSINITGRKGTTMIHQCIKQLGSDDLYLTVTRQQMGGKDADYYTLRNLALKNMQEVPLNTKNKCHTLMLIHLCDSG